MNKLSNKSIVYSLGMLAILTLGLIVAPMQARADMGGVVTPYGSTNFNYMRVTDTGVNSGASGNNVLVRNPNPIVYSNTKTTVKKTVVASKPASTLTANAVASGSSIPTIIQWILLAILILIIVILARKVFGADKNYHATPMKHA